MTSARLRSSMLLACLATSGFFSTHQTSAGAPAIHFDLPPLAVALPLPPSTVDAAEQAGECLVVCELDLSSMIATPHMPRIDQWLVRCQPRDESMLIADYQPRTEVASDVDGPVQVKELDEESDSKGLSMNGAYGHLAQANLGTDHGSKQTDSYQYNRVAPVQAVTASGTINRGRGVYFKLRWTATQVLEGEKKFTLTFRVPANWRTGLLDVSVVAQSYQRSFAAWDDGVKTVGAASFVVAAYRQGDREAALAAQSLAEAEQTLRAVARAQVTRAQQQDSLVDSIPSILRFVVTKFDAVQGTQSTSAASSWVERLITGNADPYSDKQISRLPVDVRVAALDYCDARDCFAALH